MSVKVRNEHGQMMGTIEPVAKRNPNKGNFIAHSEHNKDHIVTLTEGAARFWLWLLDERFRSAMQRSR